MENLAKPDPEIIRRSAHAHKVDPGTFIKADDAIENLSKNQQSLEEKVLSWVKNSENIENSI